MASYSSSGVQVSWNGSLLPGVGGVWAPVLVVVVLALRLFVVFVVVAVVVSLWCAMVSRVARALGFPVSGASVARAWASLWAWRAVSSSVSIVRRCVPPTVNVPVGVVNSIIFWGVWVG